MTHAFRGRTIQVVKDFSVDEQIFLYQETRRLKEALAAGRGVDEFRIQRPDLGFYLMFLEDSTRTKESFRNAAIFHGLKVNDFDARTSSFQKSESITDTVKMLLGYSAESIFVIRSKQEGVCRWLEQSMARYADKAGLPRPAFINAGDGRHEHPTQEFLDEFSFLEHLKWQREHIHLALVGDLFHGRTVHSKVEGLRIFKSVKVDLIAPQEIAMPAHYVEQMRGYGYDVSLYESLDEYLDAGKTAPLWYFTRLQLERMGDRIRDRADDLRRAVTFRREFLSRIDEFTRFFHPLPRHSQTPTIPTFLDDTPFNAWDEQSRNGYFTRIIEIGLLGGKLGGDFQGQGPLPVAFDETFIEGANLRSTQKTGFKIGIRPVDSGLVIDHIGTGHDSRSIWNLIDKIRHLLDLNMVSSHGVYHSQTLDHCKGVISIPDVTELSEKHLKMLAAISPDCTINIVHDCQVVKKYRLRMPPRVYKLEGLRCRNENCISNPELHEPIYPDFLRLGRSTFTCRYCTTPHEYKEIWS